MFTQHLTYYYIYCRWKWNVVSWSSAEAKGFKGSRKSTPYAAQVATDAGAKAFEQGLRTLTVQVKGQDQEETALRSAV